MSSRERRRSDRRSRRSSPPPGVERRRVDRRGRATGQVPRTDARVTLYDISLQSLKQADPSSFVSLLVDLKIAPDAAAGMLGKLPKVLSRYAPDRRAETICSTLRKAGADVVMRISNVTCVHCGSAVPCEGEADAGRGGINFTCRECQGLILLDLRDKKFHALLPCGKCSALLRLPADPKPGKYRCRCGQIMPFSPADSKVEFVRE